MCETLKDRYHQSTVKIIPFMHEPLMLCRAPEVLRSACVIRADLNCGGLCPCSVSDASGAIATAACGDEVERCPVKHIGCDNVV